MFFWLQKTLISYLCHAYPQHFGVDVLIIVESTVCAVWGCLDLHVILQ